VVDPAVTTFPHVINNVPRSELAGSENGIWCPLTKDWGGEGTTRVGGLAEGAYGDAFIYNSDQADTYNAQTFPKYTEWITVKFDTPVFPVVFEIGSSRGAGGIVSMKAKDSEGTWHSIYQGDALLKQNAETIGRGLYHQMAELICRPFFLADEFRIEVDTSVETGISDWNYIDYIKLFGSPDKQPAMLEYPTKQVLYVPRPDADGEDSFAAKAWDCGGFWLRSSEDAG